MSSTDVVYSSAGLLHTALLSPTRLLCHARCRRTVLLASTYAHTMPYTDCDQKKPFVCRRESEKVDGSL
eukprot:1621897-Rhodomonas_salina.6